VNRKNTKTIGKRREVVEKNTLQRGLMHVTAYGITRPPDQSSRNSGNKLRLANP